MQALGTIYLVGAGPGPVDLLTLRAARLIERAEIIVHDGLIGRDILGIARSDAPEIFTAAALLLVVATATLMQAVALVFATATKHRRSLLAMRLRCVKN